MTKFVAALGICVSAVALALTVGIVASFRFYGTAVVGILALMLAPLLLLFGLWLKGHGLSNVARLFLTASATLVLGVIVLHVAPHAAPGTAAWLKARFARADDSNGRAAIAVLAPRVVPCTAPMVGQRNETLYWWHPMDEPTRCYDRPGQHPEGKGELAPVTDAMAQLIVRTSAPKPTPAPPHREVVYIERAPMPQNTPVPTPTPMPTPTPQASQFGAATVVQVVR